MELRSALGDDLSTWQTCPEATMQELTDDGFRAVQQLSQRYGVSLDAVKTLLFAVAAGGGTMAQFYHSELGGGGQWMRGGMTMVGDMFNGGLQATVSGLCAELSTLLGSQQVFVPARSHDRSFGGLGNAWWPSELGNPSSSGGQNDARYAYFPQMQRLAIDRNGELSIYDTLDHQIGGVQQQQGGSNGSLSFSSQFGTFTVDSLPRVGAPPNAPFEPARQNQNSAPQSQEPSYAEPQPAAWQSNVPAPNGNQSHDEILGTLERLSDLHKKGILS
jgi:hypothetical protein